MDFISIDSMRFIRDESIPEFKLILNPPLYLNLEVPESEKKFLEGGIIVIPKITPETPKKDIGK